MKVRAGTADPPLLKKTGTGQPQYLRNVRLSPWQPAPTGKFREINRGAEKSITVYTQ